MTIDEHNDILNLFLKPDKSPYKLEELKTITSKGFELRINGKDIMPADEMNLIHEIHEVKNANPNFNIREIGLTIYLLGQGRLLNGSFY